MDFSTGIGSPKNHGFMTTLLNGKRVTSKVAHLTLAHELGHSFGSSHDETADGQFKRSSVFYYSVWLHVCSIIIILTKYKDG